MSRILALDVGQKGIGLAVSDEAGLGATPLYTIQRSAPVADVEKISAAAATCQAKKIVIGLPLDQQGRPGRQAAKIERLAALLQQRVSIPVVLWDERLSTVEAAGILLEADMSRKKRKRIIDAVAAARILASYMRAQESERATTERQ